MFDDEHLNFFATIVISLVTLAILMSLMSCWERVDGEMRYVACLDAGHAATECSQVLDEQPGE